MDQTTIVFTAPGIAELQTQKVGELKDNEVLLKTEYTVISPGTERANLMGEKHIDGSNRNPTGPRFPKIKGYCGVGKVVQIGKDVTSVSVGDHAVIYFGIHSSYNLVPEEKVIPLDEKTVDLVQAAPTVLVHIALGGVRMARFEVGESALIMGLGILGMYSVQLCRMNGVCPVIAADPNPERRKIALSHGADYAFDPMDKDFPQQVLAVTGGKGVNGVIEVSGAAIALPQALECVAPMGRVILLGCTRENDIPTDYYHMVHFRGVQILGAHTFVRPERDSRPGYWTYRDECQTVLSLISHGRMRPADLIPEIRLPEEAREVFERLAQRREFLLSVMFDWRDCE